MSFLNLFHQSSQGSNNNSISVGTGPLYESVFTNTILSSLISSKDWSLLLGRYVSLSLPFSPTPHYSPSYSERRFSKECRVGPDPIIKVLSSVEIALFAPLRNGCYYQIAGEPVVELKVIEKGDQEKMSKGGRKVHCRTKKKRGKKGKGMKGPEEKGAVDKEEVIEVDEMEVDREGSTQTVEVLDQPILEPIIKRTRFLGPSKSAPSLLPSTSFTPSLSLAETQSQRIAQTQVSPTKRSGSSVVNASTAVALKGTQAGLEAKQKKLEQKQIAKKLKRLPTLSALSLISFT